MSLKNIYILVNKKGGVGEFSKVRDNRSVIKEDIENTLLTVRSDQTIKSPSWETAL